MNARKLAELRQQVRELRKKIDEGKASRQEVWEYVNKFYQAYIPRESDRKFRRRLMKVKA